MLKSISLLGVHVSCVNLDSAIQQICAWVAEKQRGYVCVAPVATLVDARRDPAYAKAVNGAAMITPDGMPVVWLARLRGGGPVGRTYGPDLMRGLCQKGQKLGLKHFFYGGSEDTLKLLQHKLLGSCPDLRVAGAYAPGHHPEAWQEQKDVLDLINQSGADIVWVGLGSPKQDFWLALNRPLLEAPVLIGAGAAFDFCSGAKVQAPRWIQQNGLEWLFRLCCEPRRLWKRYLIGNSLFVMYLIRELFVKTP